MTENTVLVPAQGDQPQIVELGTVAAQNIALALNLDEKHVPTIKRAIADEINAMSAHFTLAFADVQTQYELTLGKARADFDGQVAELRAYVANFKSVFSFVQQNKWQVVGTLCGAFALGVLTGVVAFA